MLCQLTKATCVETDKRKGMCYRADIADLVCHWLSLQQKTDLCYIKHWINKLFNTELPCIWYLSKFMFSQLHNAVLSATEIYDLSHLPRYCQGLSHLQVDCLDTAKQAHREPVWAPGQTTFRAPPHPLPFSFPSHPLPLPSSRSLFPSLPFHPIRLPSPIPSRPFPSLPFFPLEVGLLNPARRSGEHCKLPERGLGRSRSWNWIWCI